MSVVHCQGMKFIPYKLQYVPFMENLHKFHLDLCIPIYRNSSQVSCLGMNLGRGWNPKLEGSYLLEYSESKAEFEKQFKSGFYLHPLQFSAPDPSPVPRYIKCTKTYQL